ncbi:MAG TPA: hypothetical protein PLV65_12525, partial [Tenuifilaceae bacterium]|nr:hypothetical protein [Tenuifilaceae bacterium]
MKKFLVIISVITLSLSAIGQIPVGAWREHFSFRPGKLVTASPEKVFVSSTNGVFWYSLANGEVGKLTTVNGLNDIDITALAYSPYSDLLAVGYINGNIDLVYNNKVVNLPYILQKPMQGAKQINHFFFIDENSLLVSTGFGIVVINLDKNEIADTYYIGDGGTEEWVWQTLIYNNRIYAATANGIYSADVNSPMLILYSTWIVENSIPAQGASYNFMAVFQDQLIANESTGAEFPDVVRAFNGEQWSLLAISYLEVTSITSGANQLAVGSQQGIAVYSSLGSSPTVLSTYPGYSSFKPNDLYIIGENDFAIADASYGLMLSQNQSWKAIMPNAPYNNNAYYILPTENEVFVTAGARNDTWGNLFYNVGIHTFSSN